MSVLELVADETRRLSRSARLPMLFVPLGAGAALLTAGAMWLARGRWLDLPAAVPFLVWVSALVGAAVLARLVGKRQPPAPRPRPSRGRSRRSSGCAVARSPGSSRWRTRAGPSSIAPPTRSVPR
jgi:hypothetical protein